MSMRETFGERFEIEAEAGQGGMASVFRALDRATGERVAVKVLHDSAPEDLLRFEREAAILRTVEDPGIVRYVTHGRNSTGRAWLAMEWLEGEDLASRLGRGGTTIDETIALGCSVARGLGAAHRLGVVHRDVKPANVFLVGGDMARPKLLDFGVARSGSGGTTLTRTGLVIGTPMYMAPEQVRGERELDARVDVFALGTVLFECLAGRPPLAAANVVALLAKILFEDAPRVSHLRAGVPASLDGLLARLLAKNADERPRDGAAVADALEALGDRGPTSIVRTSSTLALSREQRVVCVLLATGLDASALPMEATTALPAGGLQAMADGSCAVTFTGPESPSDLAARAARFALGIRAPGVAVALAAGRAVVSGGAPVGDVIDRAAARLEHASGVVRVDDDIVGLIEGRFDVAQDHAGAVLVAERPDETDAVRTLLGKPTRCFGRDRELGVLEGYWTECVSESIARVVLVTAQAGVGKSRLGRELVRRLALRQDAPEILYARSESISSGSAFAVLGSLLRRAAAIGAADDPACIRDKLTALFARRGSPQADAVDFFGEVLALPPSEHESEAMRAARANPALMFERIQAAFAAWLSRECETHPVLLLVEDLHWGDLPSTAVLDAALGSLSEHALLVLALARPEVHDVFPKLWSAHGPHAVRLDPLPKRASERLVREALGSSASADVVERIVRRAEGNAFFLEELVRAAAVGAGATTLPDGIIGVMQLRFDALDPVDRAALRAASVFGERFSRGGVEALVQTDPSSSLRALVTHELVAPDPERRHSFVFRHALVREAAYALLADDDRAVAHAVAAEHLEREGGHEPAVLADHFERGRVRSKAAEWSLRAAEHALRANDLPSAIEHAERAATRTEDDGMRGAAHLAIAEAELWRGRLEEARAAAAAAADLLPASSSAWFQAAGLVMTTAGQRGDNDAVEQWLQRAIAMTPDDGALSSFVLCLARASSQLTWAERADVARRALARVDEVVGDQSIDMHAQARLYFARAYDALYDGILDVCVSSLEHAAACHLRAGSQRDALQASLLAATFRGFAGIFEPALEELARCEARALELRADYLAEWARFEVAIIQHMSGDRAGGRATFARVREDVASQPLFQGGRLGVEGFSAIVARDFDDLRRHVESVRHVPLSPRYRAAADAFESAVELALGRSDSAAELASRSIRSLQSARGMASDVHLTGYLVAVETLLAVDPAAGLPALRNLRASLLSTAAKIQDEGVRDSFLRKVPWNARILEIARTHEADETTKPEP